MSLRLVVQELQIGGTGWLWIVFTLIAAAAQTARNAAQRELTETLGTLGATHVRFLFGLPFALVILAGVVLVTGDALPPLHGEFFAWVLLASLAQIAATALMLVAMGDRSFVVAIAYIKTEPVQVALFGLVLLGDQLTLWMGIAILIATSGVMVTSLKPHAALGDVRGMLFGLGAGAMFGLSATSYRGGILSLGIPNDFLIAATVTLVAGLVIQTVLLTGWLYWRDPAVMRAIWRHWRPSLAAGFLGAGASQFWYLAFALATAASVRTLALVEVLFAQAISHFIFHQPTTRNEQYGMVLIVAGVALLLWAR